MNLSIRIRGEGGKLKFTVIASDKYAVHEMHGRLTDPDFIPILLAMTTLVENLESVNAQSD